MNIYESIWFLITISIIAIVLAIDPKASSPNPVSGFFTSASSEEKFIYRFSALLILLFYVVTILLSYN